MKISYQIKMSVFILNMMFGVLARAMENEESIVSPRLISYLYNEIINVDVKNQTSLKKLEWISNSLSEYPTAIIMVKAENVCRDNLKALLSLLRHVRCLDVSDNNLDAEDARMIAESDYLKKLEKLNIARNNIGSSGAIALARSKKFWLRQLNLDNNNILVDAIEVIASAPRFKKLSHLNLAHNPIRDAGVKAIGKSNKLKNLRSLNLSGTEMSDVGVFEIIYSITLKNLEEFYGYANNNGNITHDAAKMVTKFFPECKWLPL